MFAPPDRHVDDGRAGADGANGLPRFERYLLALCALATMTVSHFDRNVLGAIAPYVTSDLSLSDRAYGALSASFAVAYMIGSPLAGGAIDRVGARRGVFWGLVSWSLVAGAHGLASGFASLLLLRAALGLTESPSVPGAAQMVQRGLLPYERAVGFSFLYTGASLGATLAPPIAVAVAAALDWRAAFMASALVGVLWAPLWWVIAARPRIRAALDARDARRDGPGLRAALDRHVARATCATLAVAPLIVLLSQWGAKMLVADFDVPKADVGHYLWLPSVGRDVGGVGFGFLAALWAKRRGADPGSPRPLFAAATALVCIAFGAVPFAASPDELIAFATIGMAGCGGVTALMIAEVLARAPRANVAFVGGVMAMVQQIGNVVGNLAIGEILTRTHSYGIVATALVGFAVPACAAWLMWPTDPRPHTAAID